MINKRIWDTVQVICQNSNFNASKDLYSNKTNIMSNIEIFWRHWIDFLTIQDLFRSVLISYPLIWEKKRIMSNFKLLQKYLSSCFCLTIAFRIFEVVFSSTGVEFLSTGAEFWVTELAYEILHVFNLHKSCSIDYRVASNK